MTQSLRRSAEWVIISLVLMTAGLTCVVITELRSPVSRPLAVHPEKSEVVARIGANQHTTSPSQSLYARREWMLQYLLLMTGVLSGPTSPVPNDFECYFSLADRVKADAIEETQSNIHTLKNQLHFQESGPERDANLKGLQQAERLLSELVNSPAKADLEFVRLVCHIGCIPPSTVERVIDDRTALVRHNQYSVMIEQFDTTGLQERQPFISFEHWRVTRIDEVDEDSQQLFYVTPIPRSEVEDHRRNYDALIRYDAAEVAIKAAVVAIRYPIEERIAAKIRSLGGEVELRYFGPDSIPYQLCWNGIVSVTLPAELDNHELFDLLPEVGSLKNLRCLLLSGTNLTDADVQQLQDLTDLEELYLSETSVTDTGLAYLHRLTNIRVLTLVGTPVTDAGLECLNEMTGITQLSLGGTQVTDDGLKALQHLTWLRSLNLGNTQTTADGRTRLRKALPFCEIYPAP